MEPNNDNRRRRLLLGAGLAAVVVLAIILFANWRSWFPSEELAKLRTLEQELALPGSSHRSEDDRGCYKEKGTEHCRRNISLEFSDAQVLTSIRKAAADHGWTEQRIDSSTDMRYFGYERIVDSAQYCLHGYSNPKAAGAVAVYLTIEGPTDEFCRQ